MACEPKLPEKDFARTLHGAAGGQLKESPFPVEVIESTRDSLRLLLKREG